MLIKSRYLFSSTLRAAIVSLLTTTLLFVCVQVVSGYEAEDCISCHSLTSSESRLRISVDHFRTSAHAEAFTCSDCHTDIEDEEHTALPGSGRVDCGQCHDQSNQHGLSRHADNRPQCYHCHTKHRILGSENSDSSVFPANLTETCRSCHPVQCGQASALSWLPSLKIASHNKQDLSQSYSENNCIGCHQGAASHGDETVRNDQLCYVCHAPLGESPLFTGYMHVNADATKQPLSFFAGLVYAIVLAVLVFGGIRYWFFRDNADEES